MEKRLVLIFTLLLIGFVSGVYAAEGDVGTTLLDSSYNNKSINVDSPVVLPDNLRSAANVLFHLDESDISFSVFIILIVLFAVIFSITLHAASIVPYFRDNFAKYSIALGITLIASTTGTINIIASNLLALIYGVNFIAENNSIAGFLFALVVLGVITFGLLKVINYAKNQYKIADAEKSAIQLVNEVVNSKK